MSTEEFVRSLQQSARASAHSKDLYWRNYKHRHGEAAGIRIADELRRQVVGMRPDWPSRRERAEDHAAHLRVLDALERVSSGRR